MNRISISPVGIPKRIDKLIERFEKDKKQKEIALYGETKSDYFLKNKDICESIDMSTTKFSKIRNGKQNPTYEDIQSIAEFFGISAEEFLTGNPPRIKMDIEELGLETNVIKNIKKMNLENHDYIIFLNFLLEDEQIADLFFMVVDIYANSPMLKIMPLTAKANSTEFLPMNYDTGNEMLKILMAKDLFKIFDYIKQRWDTYFKRLTKTKLPKQDKNTELDKRFRDKKKQNITKYDVIGALKELQEQLANLDLQELSNQHSEEDDNFEEEAHNDVDTKIRNSTIYATKCIEELAHQYALEFTGIENSVSSNQHSEQIDKLKNKTLMQIEKIAKYYNELKE